MIQSPLKTWWKAKYCFKAPKLKFYGGFVARSYYDNMNKWFSFEMRDLMWKHKYDTPRHEHDPYISIRLFKYFKLTIMFQAPDGDTWSDDYWEQILWLTEYSNNDPVIAAGTWPWKNYDDKSTWRHEYMTKIANAEIFNFCMRTNKIKEKNK